MDMQTLTAAVAIVKNMSGTAAQRAEFAATQAENAKVSAQEAAETASAAYGTDLLAEDYDPDTGATAGNYYIHSGDWYLCLTDTTGEWDSTKFRKTNVGEQITDLKSIYQ